MQLDELKALEFSNGEIAVYQVLLQFGAIGVNQIHEQTGMERRAIYDILNKLLSKGFVVYTIEDRTKTYKCAPLKKIEEELQEKKKILEKLEQKVPQMNSLFESSKTSADVRLFRGKEGIKSIFEDQLNYKEVHFIGGRWYVLQQMPSFWETYNKRRIKKKVHWYNLVLSDAPKIPEEKYVHIRQLPAEFSGSPSIIFIYGNKVVNVLWGEELIAFMIESKDIAENYKKYHKYLWNKVATDTSPHSR